MIYEIKCGSNRLELSNADLGKLKRDYQGVDVESVVKDCAKKSKNLNLADKRAAWLYVRNDLSMARTKAARMASAAMAAAAKKKLSAVPDSTEPQPNRSQTALATAQQERTDAAKPQSETQPELLRMTSTIARNVELFHNKAPMAVEIFKSMKSGAMEVMIQTTADSIDSYIPALSKALVDAICAEPENMDELVLAVIRHGFQIGIKVAGYKIESVKEQRILTAGHVTPADDEVVGRAA